MGPHASRKRGGTDPAGGRCRHLDRALEKDVRHKGGNARPDGHQLFSSFARQILDAKKNYGLTDDVIANLEWQLGYLIDHFGRLELLEINVAWVDGFRDALAKRSKLIRDTSARGKPLTRTVTPKHGAPYKHIEQALSNASINEMLTLLSEIMQRAVEYGYVPQNPLKAGERSHRFLPTP